jgi:hypothetical protein
MLALKRIKYENSKTLNSITATFILDLAPNLVKSDFHADRVKVGSFTIKY